MKPDVILKENNKVGSLTVIDTPGHTAGSISLNQPKNKALFVGDALRFTNQKIVGPSEQVTEDMKQAIESIGKISQFDFDLMLSGHGEPLKLEASAKVREFYASIK